jgi:hypothetical protein
MPDERQFWIVAAVRDTRTDREYHLYDYPATETISASRVADEFVSDYPYEWSVLRVAPIKAPTGWDVFDVRRTVERRDSRG